MTAGSSPPPIGSAFLRGFRADEAGPASIERIIERLSSARSQASKEENRLLVLCAIFSFLYTIKALGLRVDLVLLDQKVLEVPYGTFMFCIAAQLTSCLLSMRSADVRAYDRHLRAVCDQHWQTRGMSVYWTIPDANSWFSPTLKAVDEADGLIVTKVFFFFAKLAALVIALTIFLLPVGTGCHFLLNWRTQIKVGNIPFQYYSVLYSTCTSLIWFASSFLMHAADQK